MNQKRSSRVLAGVGRVALFVVLLVLPSLVRGVYFYRGLYLSPEVSRPDHSSVHLSASVAPASGVAGTAQDAAKPPPLKGRVIVDRAHENVVEDAELNVLVSHLVERGLQIVSSGGSEQDDRGTLAWPGLLRGASALVIISPHLPFSSREVEAVERFVEQGGRVILLGDPSRFALRPLDDADLLADDLGPVLMPESDVAALNSLASAFGLTFSDDYVYNTFENAGNYQYVILRDFGSSPLTAGLEEVVFYAAHSIAVDQESLITADERTASSLSQQRGGLATMSLGGSGQVLAVADYTFMTEPYNTTADNSRLIANIADYVAGAERTFGLSDLPHFFGEQAHLVYLADPADGTALPAEVIAHVARLQSAFATTDRRLLWYDGTQSRGSQPRGSSPAGGRDFLYIGLYAGLEPQRDPMVSRVSPGAEVKNILSSAGITFTLETSERALAKGLESSEQETTPNGPASPSITGTVAPTPTPVPPRDQIDVPGIGVVDAKQTSLFYQNERGKGQTFIALAYDRQGLAGVVERLLSGDYADCLLDEDREGDPRRIGLALCPTAYEPQGEQPPASGPPPAKEDELIPAPDKAAGGILIVSDDDGTGQYEEWTSAYDFADIATQAGHVITLWSLTVEGDLDLDRLLSFDAVIWCTGDYQKEGGTPDAEDLSMLFAYLEGGGRLILSGAFIGPPDAERGLVTDVQVAQADHPVTQGFEEGQVIALERFTADEDYVMTVLSETPSQTVLFSRGPESELTEQAAITVEDKTIWMGVPLFLLPTEARFQLANNAIEWILE